MSPVGPAQPRHWAPRDCDRRWVSGPPLCGRAMLSAEPGPALVPFEGWRSRLGVCSPRGREDHLSSVLRWRGQPVCGPRGALSSLRSLVPVELWLRLSGPRALSLQQLAGVCCMCRYVTGRAALTHSHPALGAWPHVALPLGRSTQRPGGLPTQAAGSWPPGDRRARQAHPHGAGTDTFPSFPTETGVKENLGIRVTQPASSRSRAQIRILSCRRPSIPSINLCTFRCEDSNQTFEGLWQRPENPEE